MPNYLGGYYIPSPALRRVMQNLQIDDKGIDYWRISLVINDWLAKQGKMDVFAFFVNGEGDNHGLVLVTQSTWLDGYEENVLFEEGEKEQRVKEWLMNDGGAQKGDLQWMSLCDKHQLTGRGAVVPFENSAFGRFIHLTDEQVTKFAAAGAPFDFPTREGL